MEERVQRRLKLDITEGTSIKEIARQLDEQIKKRKQDSFKKVKGNRYKRLSRASDVDVIDVVGCLNRSEVFKQKRLIAKAGLKTITVWTADGIVVMRLRMAHEDMKINVREDVWVTGMILCGLEAEDIESGSRTIRSNMSLKEILKLN